MNMINAYNEPELKVVKMTSEDILTLSTLDDATTGWEVGGNPSTPGSDVPYIEL